MPWRISSLWDERFAQQNGPLHPRVKSLFERFMTIDERQRRLGGRVEVASSAGRLPDAASPAKAA
jgi:hypothetical protein